MQSLSWSLSLTMQSLSLSLLLKSLSWSLNKSPWSCPCVQFYLKVNYALSIQQSWWRNVSARVFTETACAWCKLACYGTYLFTKLHTGAGLAAASVQTLTTSFPTSVLHASYICSCGKNFFWKWTPDAASPYQTEWYDAWNYCLSGV